MIKQLGIINEPLSGSKFHRIFNVLSPLNANFSTKLTEQFCKDYDIIWINRYIDVYPWQVAIWKEKYGFKLVFDMDDSWEVPRNNPSYLFQKEIENYSKDLCILADWVTVTILELEKEVREFNDNVTVIPNRIPYGEGQFSIKSENKEDFLNRKIKVGISGSLSHLYDWKDIKPWLHKLTQNSLFKERCELIISGIDPKMVNVYKDYQFATFIPNKPVTNYMQVYHELDIMLCPLRDDHFNGKKCIVGDSLIVTSTGIKKIQDIVSNKESITTNEGLEIIDYFKYKNSPTIKISTKNGYSIEGTPHHKILIQDKWTELQDLKLGDNIELTPFEIHQKEYQWISYPMLLTKKIVTERENDCDEDMTPRIKITEKWGRFLGYMIGDGSFHKQGLSISCDKRHTKVVEDVVSLVKGLGLYPQYMYKQPDKRCQTLRIKEGNALDIRCSSRTFRKIAEKYNWVNENGKVFEIPKVILESPKSVIREFLKGLFESDGCVTSSGITFCSKSETLIKQIQIILLSFNIKSFTGRRFNKQYQKYYWYLDMGRESSEIFHNEIGFISAHKSEKLAEICSKGHSNAFKPFDWFDEIVEIQEGINTVYDIEVDKEHRYNGNGIINHNSSLKILESACSKTICILDHLYKTKSDLLPSSHLFVEKEKEWYSHVINLIQDKENVWKLKEQTSQEIISQCNWVKDALETRVNTVMKIKDTLSSYPKHYIFSIKYKEEQPTFFWSYFNKVKTIEEKSWRFEYNAMLDIFDNKLEKVKNEEYVGVLSWKFPQKTKMFDKKLERLIKDKDIYTFCHPLPNPSYMNYSENHHPGLKFLVKTLCDRLGLIYKDSPKNVIYSNFVVAKKYIYKDYIENVIKPSLELLEGELWDLANKDSGYKAGLPKDQLKMYTGLDYYNMVTFTLERMWSQYLNDKKYSIKNLI